MRRVGRVILSLIYLLVLSPGAIAEGFYDIDSVNLIEITFEMSNWDDVLDQLYDDGDEERLVGSAVINGVLYDSVGVRYKGSSSYSRDRVKNPLNIKLDHIIDDQKIEGYGTLKLANCYQDPSFVREVLSYEIARKYLPAGLANYISVYVNGSYLGLYTSVQSVDRLFARTHLGSDDGARFKGELEHEAPSVIPVWGYFGPDSSDYTAYYEMKSDSGWGELIEFLDTLNNFSGDVEAVLDVDRHLWMLAYDNLMVNLDAPINFGHNYYLIQGGEGRFHPIIWDLNMNFGGFTLLLTEGDLSSGSMQTLDPFIHADNPYYPIVNRVLSNPSYRKMYVAHMKTMMAENFDNNWYILRALEIQGIIDGDVMADPNKFYLYGDFLSNLYNTVPGGPTGESVIGIHELMDDRLEFLHDEDEFTFSPPVVAEITHAPEVVAAGSDLLFTADVAGADRVWLGYRHSSYSSFAKEEMYDDGLHNDGPAGDGIYGVVIGVGLADVQYYLYAENGVAGVFAPVRAEYEFYQVDVVSGVVINEFMASNSMALADQDGEYDDWIELYNGTDVTISLAGYCLSDDVSDLAQWAFPDTSIEARGYLLVWADKDSEQAGLHANFKLSASGETLLLVGPSAVVADEICFGAQTTDVSLGRFPNGADNWEMMTDFSPGASNVAGSCICGEFTGGFTGNANCSADGLLTLSDIMTLIDAVYITHEALCCEANGNVNGSVDGKISLSDIATLIDNVYLTGTPTASCP